MKIYKRHSNILLKEEMNVKQLITNQENLNDFSEIVLSSFYVLLFIKNEEEFNIKVFSSNSN
jgi:hypothetical protein